MKKKSSVQWVFYRPVGIPSTLEPRPNPLITGPPIRQGSIGNVFSIPENANYKVKSLFLPGWTNYTWKGVMNRDCKYCLQSWNGGRPHFSGLISSKELTTSSADV